MLSHSLIKRLAIRRLNGNKFTIENKGQGQSHAATSIMSRRCFGCGSSSHLLNACPERRSTFMSGSKSNAQSKQLSHCAVENSYRDEKCQSADDKTAYDCGQRCVTGVLTASGDSGDTGIQAGAEPPGHGSGDVGLQRAAPVFTDSPDLGAQNDVNNSGVVADELVIHNSVDCVDSFFVGRLV